MQCDDFWTITIDRRSFQIISTLNIDITERNGFTTRNSMAAVTYKDRIVFFGGQNSEE